MAILIPVILLIILYFVIKEAINNSNLSKDTP